VVTLADYDSICLHTPFCRHVQKAIGRLAFADFRDGTTTKHLQSPEQLESVR
jgi:3-hydroxy-3-methylglutaryl CoA synthase